jgi:hypothetical protein
MSEASSVLRTSHRFTNGGSIASSHEVDHAGAHTAITVQHVYHLLTGGWPNAGVATRDHQPSQTVRWLVASSLSHAQSSPRNWLRSESVVCPAMQQATACHSPHKVWPYLVSIDADRGGVHVDLH